MKNLNYNTDNIKHYVRLKGWVRPFKTILNYVDREFKAKRRPDRCKYLTFCAVQAIDVFLFEEMQYLYRNKESLRLENVYFCENDEEAFTVIQKIIGSAAQGFFGDFKKIMLQREGAAPGNPSDPFDEPEDTEQREIQRLTRLKETLLTKFPFDVINLDFYGNFFPHDEGRYSESFQTYKEILKLQKLDNGSVCKRFLMFITVYTPMFNEKRFVSPEAITSFEQVLFENLVHDEFRSAVEVKYGTTNFKEFEVYIKFILGFVKQVLFKETYKQGWIPQIHDILTYNRLHSDQTPHKETTFIVEFDRCEDFDNHDDFQGAVFEKIKDKYKAQLLEIVTNKPEQVPSEDEIPQDVKDSLQKVREFRDAFLKDLGIYDPRYFA